MCTVISEGMAKRGRSGAHCEFLTTGTRKPSARWFLLADMSTSGPSCGHVNKWTQIGVHGSHGRVSASQHLCHPEEIKLTGLDVFVHRAVKQHGEGCWAKLVPLFPGRIGKQLRERWNHELRPDINKQAWSADEETMLVHHHRQLGNCWADIAKVGIPRWAARYCGGIQHSSCGISN
jgi:hypothetical protein